jgi:hypothetical protein
MYFLFLGAEAGEKVSRRSRISGRWQLSRKIFSRFTYPQPEGLYRWGQSTRVVRRLGGQLDDRGITLRFEQRLAQLRESVATNFDANDPMPHQHIAHLGLIDVRADVHYATSASVPIVTL